MGIAYRPDYKNNGADESYNRYKQIYTAPTVYLESEGTISRN